MRHIEVGKKRTDEATARGRTSAPGTNRNDGSGPSGPFTAYRSPLAEVNATAGRSAALDADGPYLPGQEAALAGAMQDVFLQILAAHSHGALLVRS